MEHPNLFSSLEQVESFSSSGNESLPCFMQIFVTVEIERSEYPWNFHERKKIVYPSCANEDQEGCCPCRLQACSCMAEEADARQAGPCAVSARVGPGLGFRWWQQLELFSSVVCL